VKAHLQTFEEEVSAWEDASVHPHRFDGVEFRFGSAEFGHIHTNGIIDIPFHRPYTMCCWQMVLLRNITGFPIQAGSHFVSAVKKTVAMSSGSCDCRTPLRAKDIR